MTARWVVDEVRPARDLTVGWQPISLLVKNELNSESEYYETARFGHNLMRVMEAVRSVEGDEPIEALYWQYGRRIHHDKTTEFTAAEALSAVGLATSYSSAFDDDGFDAEIKRRMALALKLAGNDVGTPIIAYGEPHLGEERVAIFGPVITAVPDTQNSLRLWDGVVACASVPGFWELKRTRTDLPDFGARP